MRNRKRLDSLWLHAALWLVAANAANDCFAEGNPAPNFVPQASSSIVPEGAKLELVWNDGDFTEGPASTPDGKILFSDIGNRIMELDPRTMHVRVFREPSGKANGLMFDAVGRLLACEGGGPGGNRRVSITDHDGSVRALAEKFAGKRFNSPNDLAIGRDGRVYFTDPRYGGDDPRELEFEGVFLVDSSGRVQLATRDVEKPNGILVTPDGRTVYVADNNSSDSGAHQLLAFRVLANGLLEGKRVLFDFGPNRRGIDGMALDEQGNIYATAGHGDEAGVYVFNRQGRPLAFIPTPGDPTNCEFGTRAGAHTLYITAGGPAPQGNKPRRFGLYRIELKNSGDNVFPKVMP